MGTPLQILTAARARIRRVYDWIAVSFEGKRGESLIPEKTIRRRKQLSHLLYAILLSVSLSAIVVTPGPRTPKLHKIRAGELMEKDLISPMTVDIEPRLISDSKKEELSKKIAPVFDYDDATTEDWIQRWQQAFSTMRHKRPNTSRQELTNQFYEMTGAVLSEQDLTFLRKQNFSVAAETLFVKIAKHLLGRLISPTDLFPFYYSTGIVVRQVNRALGETFVYDLSRIWSLEQAAEFLNHVPNLLTKENRPQARRMAELVSHVMVPNLKFNSELTQKRTSAALAAVQRTVWNVRRGQVLIKRGERVSEGQAELVDSLVALQGPRAMIHRYCLYTLLFLTILIVLLRSNITKKSFRYLPFKDAVLFMTLALCMVYGVKIFLPYVRLLFQSVGILEGVEYIIPVSFGGIIIHLMMGKEPAQTFAMIVSVALGLMLDAGLAFAVWAYTVQVSSIHTVRACKQRNDLFKAGAASGLLGMLFVGGFYLIKWIGLLQIQWMSFALILSLSFVSGLLAAAISATLIPILESLLGYTTSLKLLELSNFNHPLLHNLMIKAPGTYHHSVIVGSLAEIAADKVKANGLLARVSAYYHDIGKMSKPLYFIENQAPNNNPHDHLQPLVSAKILFSHVKNGVRLAKEHNLGAKITSIIEQHHGTTMVSYFLNKAKRLVTADSTHLDESEFRYPGPRPQSREAAIVMLADACEAATRSIPEPSPQKIQGMVREIINRRILDEQFSECDLTFNDLNSIEEVFTRTLVSLYHHRIEYPVQNNPNSEAQLQTEVKRIKESGA